jgi:ABC-type dipeptide/oligopeptide/nickel transport system permease component
MNHSRISWILPLVNLIAIAIWGNAFNVSQYPTANIIVCAVVLLVFIIGMVLGVIGLKKRDSGRSKSKVFQSLLGIGLNAFFFIVLIRVAIQGMAGENL